MHFFTLCEMLSVYLLVNKKHLVEVDYMDIGIVINLVL